MTQTAPISFEYKLAYHSAPALMGYKPASLFSLSRQEYDLEVCTAEFRRNAGRRGLRIRFIPTCGSRTLSLVFQETMMRRQLRDPKRRAVLARYGYQDGWDMEACLSHLAYHMSHGAEFPHETGIFLGYPVEDVLGFIQNRGENCKLCGFWKIYDNPQYTQQIFAVYDRCRSFLCGQIEQGRTLYQALPSQTALVSCDATTAQISNEEFL